MEYPKGYVFELMAKGGPTDIREPYFTEAVDEMMRARVLCAKANADLRGGTGRTFWAQARRCQNPHAIHLRLRQ